MCPYASNHSSHGRRQPDASGEEFWRSCIGKFRRFFRANRLGLFQKTKEK